MADPSRGDRRRYYRVRYRKPEDCPRVLVEEPADPPLGDPPAAAAGAPPARAPTTAAPAATAPPPQTPRPATVRPPTVPPFGSLGTAGGATGTGPLPLTHPVVEISEAALVFECMTPRFKPWQAIRGQLYLGKGPPIPFDGRVFRHDRGRVVVLTPVPLDVVTSEQLRLLAKYPRVPL